MKELWIDLDDGILGTGFIKGMKHRGGIEVCKHEAGSCWTMYMTNEEASRLCDWLCELYGLPENAMRCEYRQEIK